MDQRGAGAEVDLRRVAGLDVERAGGLGRQLLADVGHQATHGRVAASPAVPALQRRVDGHAREALLNPGRDLAAMSFQRGDGGADLARTA